MYVIVLIDRRGKAIAVYGMYRTFEIARKDLCHLVPAGYSWEILPLSVAHKEEG